MPIEKRNRIATWRRRRGLTLEQLAKRITELGFVISFQQISKLERGQVRLTSETLTWIAKALAVQPADVLSSPVTRVTLVEVVRHGIIEVPGAGRPSMSVACPPGCDPSQTEVIEVVDNHLNGFAPPGWLIYYHRLDGGMEPDVVGHPAVCQLTDGRRIVGTLQAATQPGFWHLIFPQAAPLLDVRLIAAARIRAILPKDLALLPDDETGELLGVKLSP